ncbi:MAG TPA: ATP-dependent DNA helicase [Streptosporangiaceae bacterium]|nr:ATP-dependent DNA helicase [Streptosporangiaceae bacterium]
MTVPAGKTRHDPAEGHGGLPTVPVLLAAAVADIGGAERPGQVAMATAVRDAIDKAEHLAVQAGTGTGKSLAYLVPAVRHALTADAAVVVSTATIALQRQLIERDLPRLAKALRPALSREPVFAILKGRRNYLCLHRLQAGAPDDPDQVLFDSRTVSAIGRQVKRLHEWAQTTTRGDRDELVPGVDERAWRQVAVSATECLGTRCPLRTECFAEKARDEAGEADIVVTNHALLAIDAIEDFHVLPEHDVVIIDEAHDLVDRVTSVASAELSASMVDTAARRCGRLIAGHRAGQGRRETQGQQGRQSKQGRRRIPAEAGGDSDVADRLGAAGEALTPVLAEVPGGRLDVLPEALAASLAVVRDAAHECAAELRLVLKRSEDDPERLAIGRAALTITDDVHNTCARLLESFHPDIAARSEVVWLDRPYPDDARRPPMLRVAPLDVGAMLAERLFGRQTVVLTSATLALGGSFEPLAQLWGLPPLGGPSPIPNGSAAESTGADEAREDGQAGDTDAAPHASALTWSGIDVGSPFDHPRSGILYIARHLPPPGRDGLPEAYLDELGELIIAAGGRTLGLFSSMRAARQAADDLRDRIGHPLLCQGDDATSQLITQFASDEPTCLFGTLSLWQGVDVPGPSLQLVAIDRIPFPRPDDPLASARQRSVTAHGGNGFMAVAATGAALLLAQGTGRLLRTMTDRGVVAILDPRLATARYGSFLRASLPPLWTTTDPEVVRGALRRLAALSPGPRLDR